jgi:toxin ParE1/3/4
VKLRYTLPALADLNSILDTIAAQSPQGAERVQGRIQRIIGLLLVHPDIGIRTDGSGYSSFDDATVSLFCFL